MFRSSTIQNTEETIKNTLAIAELKVYIKALNGRLDQISEVRKEIKEVDERMNHVLEKLINSYTNKSTPKQ